jgi:hypothetical protein
MVETLLGGLLGGVFRIIPEIMKYFDAKNERAHEIKLTDKQIEFEQVRGAQKMSEIGAASQAEWDKGAMDTLKTSIENQFKLTGTKIDILTYSVRPVITYWFMLLYCVAKTAIFYAAIIGGAAWHEAVKLAWTEADNALWAAILNFWFLSRVFEKSIKQ